MKRGGINRVMPRGLYGRAALILILPFLTLLVVVSVLFVQRHYEGVAEQMTRNLVVSITYMQREIAAAPDLPAAQATVARLVGPLAVRASLPPPEGDGMPAQDLRDWEDLTGRAVVATLRSELPELLAVDLATGRREVRLWLATAHGPLLVTLERRRVSASNPHQLLVIVGIAGLLMTGIAFVFLRNQLRPIEQLAAAADAFGKGRRIFYRPRGAAEVRAAGRAFVEMRDRIERQIAQRTLMLSAVSHDLRTPLTRLKLGLALMEEGPATEALTRDVDDMGRLIDSFLEFSRDATVDPPAPTDAVALVGTVVENARRAGHDVALVRSEGAGQTAALRPQLLTRALENLIGNGVRYGGRCIVEVVVTPRAVRISVEDDGPGIAPDRRQEAMEPFTRLDLARNQDRGSGVGLGLAIVADAVRGHGGRMRLEDGPTLGGLRVDLQLPR